MSVEGGPSGAVAGVTGAALVSGPSVLVRGPAFEAAPAMAGGPINEGPFRGSLEGFRLMNITDKPIDDKGGSSSPVSGVDAEDAILEAEFIIKQPGVNLLTKETAVREAEHWLGITNKGNTSTALARIEKQAKAYPLAPSRPKYQILSEDIIEGSFRILEESPETGSKASSVLIHNTRYEEKNNSVIPKQVAAEVRQQPSGQVVRQEEVVKKRYLVDKIALSKRILGIGEAVRKAKEIVGGLKIPGRLVSIFWAGEKDPENLSQAVRPGGSDGSISEIREEINSKTFTSEEEALKDSLILIDSKKPVKEGSLSEDGEEAGEESIRRVFKFHLFKGGKPNQIAEKRNLSKTVSVSSSETRELRQEARIEDYPSLARVFKSGLTRST